MAATSTSTSTSRSSAPATPGCGPRCRCSRPSRRCASSSSSGTTSASAPADATEGGARRCCRSASPPSNGATAARAAVDWQRAMIDTVDAVGTLRGVERHGRPRCAVPQGRDADRRPQRGAAAAHRGRGGRGAALRVRRGRRRVCSMPPTSRIESTRRVPSARCSRRTVRRSTRCASLDAIADAATRRGRAHRRRRRRRRRRDSTASTTTAGTIRADVVVLATEAYTSQLPGTGAATCCRSTR